MTRLEGAQLRAYYAHRVNINMIAFEHLQQATKELHSACSLIIGGNIDFQLAADTVRAVREELEKIINEDETKLEQLEGVDYD